MSIQQNFPAITPSLSLNFARSKTLDPRITFSRTSTATRVNEQGLVEVMSADIPRFDHEYDASTGAIKSLGLLVEESRQNLCVNSTSSSNWSNPNNLTKSSSKTITAPSGETDAYEWTETTDTGTHLNNGPTISITSGNSYTISAFFKQVSGSGSGFALQWYKSGGQSVKVTYLPSTDTTTISSSGGASDPTNVNVTSYPNGWYRISFVAVLAETSALSIVIATDSSGNASYTGSTSNSFSFWGLQYEAGAFPTSYIPTSGSTATRNPDSVTMTGDNFSDWYNQEQGSIVWIGRVYTKEDPGLCAFRINRTDGENLRGMAMQIDTRYSNNNNTINFMSRTQSSNIPSKVASVGIVTSTSTIKLAGGYIESVGLSTIRAAFNGDPENSYSGSSQTDVVDGAMNELEIMGERGTSGANYYFTGVCEQLVYYPRILTDAQLQSLTK